MLADVNQNTVVHFHQDPLVAQSTLHAHSIVLQLATGVH